MPELPEVKVVISALKKHILNKKISALEIYHAKLFREHQPEVFIKKLVGRTIKNITNRGKHIIIFLDDDLILLSHLRMEGKYRYYEANSLPLANDHLIAKFIFDDQSELHYLDSRRFGTFHLRTTEDYNKILPLSKIAAEPDKINVELLWNKIKSSTTPIKTKLLDQELVAGIGNIYADEALYCAQVNPSTLAKDVSLKTLDKIIKCAAKIMKDSFEKGGTTLFSYESLNKQEGQYQNFLKVHGDRIRFCPTCKSKIIKIKVNNRGTYFCPKCQSR